MVGVSLKLIGLAELVVRSLFLATTPVGFPGEDSVTTNDRGFSITAALSAVIKTKSFGGAIAVHALYISASEPNAAL
jgi:hypothetical protein